MSVLFYKADLTQSGKIIVTDVNDTDVFVDTDVVLGSTDQYVLGLFGSNHDVWVKGTLIGAEQGLLIGNYKDGGTDDNRVHVAQGGSIFGHYTGLAASGEIEIVNNGEISGGLTGVNFGTDHGVSTLNNEGTISGGQYGVVMHDLGEGQAEVFNHGLIEGDTALNGSDESDRVFNRGTMRGTVTLDEGHDLFDNRGGAVVDGFIYGGDGQDVFRPGMGAEHFYGDDGIDTLDFRFGGGVSLSLADGGSAGAAQGDTYSFIEHVWGSQSAADVLAGDDADNTLRGGGGGDQLSGAAGADTLEGGMGRDVLRGGAGADSFLFLTPTHGRDVVRDFKAGDVVKVGSFGFGLAGSGEIAAELFRSRADNKAQDGDDRFIFRTTDRTLWFDADGKGGAGPALLAEMQAGAVVEASDILLV